MWFFKILLTSGLSIAVLFVLCRLNGQRTVAQMTVFDYLNGITIGSIAAELATNLESWQEPLLAMVLYGLITAGINKLNCKSLAARRVLNGRPVVVLENGRIDARALSRANIDLNEFLIQCRSAHRCNRAHSESRGEQHGSVLTQRNRHLCYTPNMAKTLWEHVPHAGKYRPGFLGCYCFVCVLFPNCNQSYCIIADLSNGFTEFCALFTEFTKEFR